MIEVKGVGVTGPGARLGQCYNEETFSEFLPVQQIPPKDLFISASGHAMTCEELVTWLLTKRAWVNPMHQAPFTPEDIAAIRGWKHPQIARLAELDKAAVACLAAARVARRAGDEASARARRAQAATLAPYHVGLAAFDRWMPLIKSSRRRVAVPMPAGALSAPPERAGWRQFFGLPLRPTPAAAAPAPAPAPGVARPEQTTWDALRRLATLLMQDANGDSPASCAALIAWREYADTLSREELASIDAHVLIFSHPFSVQYRSVVDPAYRVSGRQCGVADLGRQLHSVLQAIPQGA